MTLPKENLDNKAFSDLLKEAISRIPVYAPEWTDHNIHDPGITFIELFAWLTEMQIYRLNRINVKSYRKFLKLMGIQKLRSASAAKVDVTFSLLPDVTQAKVPRWTKVAAIDPVTGEHILFQTEQDIYIELTGLNTVPAVHAVPYNNIKFSSTGLPNFYIDLKYVPLLDKALLDEMDETKQKIKLTVNSDEKWEEVEDFDASKPGDKHYTVDLTSGRVTFGNGINGKIPPKGTDNITVSYFSGGGTRGNVKPGSITKILSENLLDKVTVNNEKEASGGTEAETLEEAIQRVRKEMKEVTRAVKSADYEYLALITSGVRVARAKALPRYHPSQYGEVPGIISVIVVPKNSPNNPNPNPKPSQDFLEAVYWHLEEYRLLATELFVLPPMYVEISVCATLGIKPKRLPDAVIKDVNNTLKDFLDPGGFDGKGWPFGRPVYISEIYEKIDGVDGVDYVEGVTLSGILKTESGDVKISPEEKTGDIVIPAEGLVYLGNTDITNRK
jgi:hypothetical protein